MATLFKSKFQTPYGPGKSKSPVSSAFPKLQAKKIKSKSSIVLEGIASEWYDYAALYEQMKPFKQQLIDQIFQLSPWFTFGGGLTIKNNPNPYDGIAKYKNWDGTYYGQVGRALGFTENEIRHLVSANDRGLSFAIIAALIEEHPPVLSSAYTDHRKAEEAAFCANVRAAIAHKNAARKPNPATSMWKMYEDHLFLVGESAPQPPPKPSKEFWSMDHFEHATGKKSYSLTELNIAVNSSLKNWLVVGTMGV